MKWRKTHPWPTVTLLMPRSHQTFHPVPAVKLLRIMLRNRCWPTTFHTITLEMPMGGARGGRCDQPLRSNAMLCGARNLASIIPRPFGVEMLVFIWPKWPEGWSHQPVRTPSISISDSNSVESGGPTSISQHNPEKFHSWNQTESLVWSGHHEYGSGLD